MEPPLHLPLPAPSYWWKRRASEGRAGAPGVAGPRCGLRPFFPFTGPPSTLLSLGRWPLSEPGPASPFSLSPWGQDPDWDLYPEDIGSRNSGGQGAGTPLCCPSPSPLPELG